MKYLTLLRNKALSLVIQLQDIRAGDAPYDMDAQVMAIECALKDAYAAGMIDASTEGI